MVVCTYCENDLTPVDRVGGFSDQPRLPLHDHAHREAYRDAPAWCTGSLDAAKRHQEADDG